MIGAGILAGAIALYLVTWYVARPPEPAQPVVKRSPPKMRVGPRTPTANLPELPGFEESESGAYDNPGGTGPVSNSLARVLHGQRQEISPTVIDEFLRKKNRSASSLLAAWQASKNREYLLEAAKLFPNEPRVQFEVIARHALSEERAEWIARFKQSAPYNPVANYFAADEFLRQKQPAKAIEEIVTGSMKAGFDDYSMASVQEYEELFALAGLTPLEAKAAAASGQTWPPRLPCQMMGYVAHEAVAQQNEYIAAGDNASAEAIANAVVLMGSQLTTGAGSRSTFNQLVGIGVETRVLEKLNPNQKVDWLGQTPAERLADLNELREQIISSRADFKKNLSTLSESEASMYFKLVKSTGELEAMRWLNDRTKNP